LAYERLWRDVPGSGKKTAQNRDSFEIEADEMLAVMRQVPLIRHEVMAFYQQLRIDKKDIISDEIEKTKKNL
jgi:hypothetical protein